VRGRVDPELGHLADDLAGDGIEPRHPLDLVAPELDAVRRLLVRGLHLERVALDAELPA
jgi:hypothetical protein